MFLRAHILSLSRADAASDSLAGFPSCVLKDEQGEAEGRRRVYLSVKFVWEWVLALSLLLLSGPIVLMLAIVVKCTSPGPAFYSQTRLGKHGQLYRIFKLRTMGHHAEAQTGPVWAAKNDCRVTPVGKALRKTHLDELPQLWNVIRGEMSLIGPRPERPEIAMRLRPDIPGYDGRLRVRPGITGLAQMLVPADDPNDAALEGVRRKVAHDLFYVREINFLLDLRIAFSTPCYFLAAAVDAMRYGLVRSYGELVEPVPAGGDEDARA